MMDEHAYIAAHAPNPAYGSGAFVRCWAMRRLACGRLRVAMEDPFHAYALEIAHDDRQVTGLEAHWIRHPLSSCAGSAAALETLVGRPLVATLDEARKGLDFTAHCTHLFDSLCLGIVHAAAARPDRRYDVILPDAPDGAQRIHLAVDGAVRLSLRLGPANTVSEPDWLGGAPLMRGFNRWAKDRLSPEQVERVFMIQRSLFVSWGRKVDTARYEGLPARLAGPPEASCFGSQPHRYEGAVRLASARPGLTAGDALDF